MRRYVIDIVNARDSETDVELKVLTYSGRMVGTYRGALIPALQHAQDFITRDLENDPL